MFHHLRMTNKRKRFILMIMCEKSKRKREKKNVIVFSVACIIFLQCPEGMRSQFHPGDSSQGIVNCILFYDQQRSRRMKKNIISLINL